MKGQARMARRSWLLLGGAGLVLLALVGFSLTAAPVTAQGGFTPTPRPLFAVPDPNATRVHRSSVIALSSNQRYLYTANTFSGTASIVDISNKSIVAEIPVGADPRALAVDPDDEWLAVTSREEGIVSLIDLETEEVTDTIYVGLWPWGVVSDGGKLYVALQGQDAIAEVDRESKRVLRLMPVPDEPAGLALYGDFLYISHLRGGALSMLYLPTGQIAETSSDLPDTGLAAAVWINPYDGVAFLPATRYNPSNPLLTFDTTVFPVVDVFRLRDMQIERQQRIVLDVADRPVNMPFDLTFDRARRWLWVVNAGSDDVSVIDTQTGFARANIPVGANPRGITRYADGSFAFVYNALDGTISVIETAYLEETDKLPATRLDLPIDLLIGAQAFYGSADPRYSEDRHLSCATCHFDGLSDGHVWVDFPDGTARTPTLLGVADSGPWGAQGEYDELADFNHYYLTVQHGEGLLDGPMLPPEGDPNAGRSPDLDALVAYMQTLKGPGRNALEIPPEDVLAGETVFLTQACDTCHVAPLYADGLTHDLEDGSGSGPIDTPSLRWLWAGGPYYHDGRAATLQDVFDANAGPHHLLGVIPYEHLQALVTYLRSLPLEE
jgi:YVTN family beta-propeller protein